MRAVGLIRVSRVKGREGDRFISPSEQADRITQWCETQGTELVTIHRELDVSGGAELGKRPGLSAALASIENGEADVIVVAYFDRLFRSLKVQAEVLDRVEKAGGRVFALDAGEVTGATDGEWLHAGFLGLVSEYQRRQVKGRMAESQSRAIARGVATWDVNIPGYSKGKDGVLVPDEFAPVTRQAFEMRRDGATIAEVREFLRGHGINRSYHGVSCLLKSRVVLGELHFGKLVNLQAHEPIVDRVTWQAVQNITVPRGRKPKSTRLLARLGVLRCGTCGSRMVVATNNHSRYWVYRCPPTGDCERRQAISATIVEEVVERTVRDRIDGMEGTATPERQGREIYAARDQAQADLDAAIRAFAGVAGEAAAVERIRELTEIRDVAQANVDRFEHLRDGLAGIRFDASLNWDRLTLDEKRALVQALVAEVTVSPGRGAERLSLTLREDATGG